jgi:hypothetical protein
MRHELLKKKREKMACPRSMTQKKIGTHEGPSVEKIFWTHEGPRKKRNIYINIAMSSCYPNKGERDS